MPKKSKVPSRNQSPTGWWLYREVEQWVSDRQKKITANSKFPIWVNTRIIKAKNRDHAFSKAMKLSSTGYPMRTNGGEWRFVGISQLLPIYEDLEDGAEIMWEDRGKLPIKSIKRLAKSKRQLVVFDDKEP
jgi:hypothetical protein